jgi:Dipeptidyl aminopeptidases/acylaminoacyl-peptidases
MQKAVEIVNRGLTLRGMLHIPEGDSGKVPGVVIFHGFTGQKMEPHFIFVKLSRALEKAGIASARFDFGCSGESDGDFKDMTPETEISDAKAILDYLYELDFIDKSRVGIVGLSMGGYVGGITAGDNMDMVKTLCMWAPAGNIKHIIKNNLDSRIPVGGGLVDIGGLVLNEEAYRVAGSIDHIGRTRAFTKTTCIIRGTNDISVPQEFVLEYRDNMSNVEYHSIEGADHTFSRGAWEQEVIGITTEFLQRTL